MPVLKKKYFDVKLELLNTIVPLLAFKQEELEGKIIKFDLTKILKGKGCEASFIVKKEGDKLVGEVYNFRIYPSYIKRLIGRGVSIVEDSFVCETKDKSIRFKPFLITRKKVHRSVRKALRNKAKELIIKEASAKTKNEIFRSVISASLQKALSKKLKKIYPLAVCELRVVKIEKSKK